MPKPCSSCPFRVDFDPGLTERRMEELAAMTSNQYNDFICHKTLDNSEDTDAYGRDRRITARSKQCAGFIAMQHNATGKPLPDGFTYPDTVFTDSGEMMQEFYLRQEEDGQNN